MLRKILSAAGFFFIYLIVILLATFYQKPIFLFLLMLLLLLPPASYLAARYAVRHLQPEITTSLLFGHSYEVNCPVYAHDSFAFSIPLTFRRAACYQIRLTQITVWDYLHFFTFHKEVTLQKELFIFPPENDSLQFSSAAFGEGKCFFQCDRHPGIYSGRPSAEDPLEAECQDP